MFIYVFISVFSIFIIYISYTKYGKVIIRYGNKSIYLTYILCIFLIFLFCIVMGFRDSVIGIDTATYMRIYKKIANASSIPIAIEQATFTGPLYIAISWIISRFSVNPQIMLILTSGVVNIGLYKFLKNTSIDIPLSLFVWIGMGLFYFSMNGNRQTIAMVINLNALYWIIEEKKYMKGWIFVLMATGIHPSSIIMLLVFAGSYCCKKIKDIKLLFFISFGMGIIADVFFRNILNILLVFLPGYVKYTVSVDGRATIFEETGGGRIGYLYIFLLILCAFWCFRGYIKNEKLEHKFFPVLVFSLTFGFLNRKNIYISRMLLYYLSTYTVFIPAMINKIRKKQDKVLILIGFIAVMFLYSILSLVENQNGVVPYRMYGG